MGESRSDGTEAGPTVLRVSLDYDRGSVDILGAEFVADGVPLDDPEPDDGSSAVWLRAKGGRRAFARRLPDPEIGQEVFDEDGGISRREAERRRTITVDVPWFGDSTEIAVLTGDATQGDSLDGAVSEPWRPIGRFEAGELKSLADIAAAADATPSFPVVVLPFRTGNPKALELVFISEGFRADELGRYGQVVDAFLDKLVHTAPFDALKDTLAARRVDAPSRESGLDDLDAGVRRDTLFSGRFGRGALRRLIEVDQGAAAAVGRAAAGGRPHVVLVIANTTEYGGSGGQVAVFSCEQNAANIALHELGHTLFGLADEYSDAGGATGSPSEPNVTGKPNPGSSTWTEAEVAQLKWRSHLTPGAPVPRITNPNCAAPLVNAPDHGVGVYEGAKYSHCRVFRPAATCKMRNVRDAFCPVCSEEISRRLRKFR